MAIDTVSANAAAGAKIGAGRTSLASSYETFLALLTTQLQNQDPTAPLDTNTFTQQLVQMSGVEQQLLTNDLLKSLTEKDDALTSAVGYIGRSVTAEAANVVLQDGGASWSYDLPRSADSATLEVLDASGRVVRRETGQTGEGAHAFAWDGKDQAGAALADGGRYTLRVTAVDALGAKVSPTITTQGVVSAVEHVDGVATLIVNGASVPLSAVTAVRQTS